MAGALAASDSGTSSPDDYDLLKRNSYITMGLLVAVLLFLIGLTIAAIAQCRGARKQGYRPVRDATAFVAPVDKPYSSEPLYGDYSNPYSDAK